MITKTRHTYFETPCACGHWSRCEPGRCEAEEGWTVDLTEWHMAGPMLVTFIGFLALHMRMSRPLIHERLHEWIGIYLSRGALNQCNHEVLRTDNKT
jgi:transposase